MKLYNYQHIFMFQIPAYFAGFACYYYKSIKITSIIGVLILSLGLLGHELSFVEMGVSLLMVIVWGGYLSVSKYNHKTLRWFGENSLLLYHLGQRTLSGAGCSRRRTDGGGIP